MNKKILIIEANKILKNINKLSRKQIKLNILFFGDKLKITVIPDSVKSEIFKILKYCLNCKSTNERKFFINIVIKKLKFEIPHRAGRVY